MNLLRKPKVLRKPNGEPDPDFHHLESRRHKVIDCSALEGIETRTWEDRERGGAEGERWEVGS